MVKRTRDAEQVNQNTQITLLSLRLHLWRRHRSFTLKNWW